MTVLVSGAAGFVGRHVVNALHARGVEVIGLTRRPAALPCHTITVDLADTGGVHAAIAELRPDTVVHLAWYAVPGAFWQAPENLDAVGHTFNLARAAVDAGCTRFVGAGSVAEYRWDTPLLDEASPREPATLYGWAKKAAHEVLEAYLAPRCSFAWLRYGWMFGPGEPPGKLVSSLAAGLAAGLAVPCSDGSARRDYLYVEDVADATVAVATGHITGAVNVGAGTATRVGELIDAVERAVGRGTANRGALPKDHPAELVLDVTRLKREVGWSPRWSLAEGVRRTVRG